MKTLGNLIWLCFGIFTTIGYFIGGILSCMTIFGIGNGLQSFKLGTFTLWPFGSTIEKAEPSPFGIFRFFGNIFWFCVSGWWIALTHVFIGVILCCTVVLIPFAKKHFQFAGLALAPYGKVVVPKVNKAPQNYPPPAIEAQPPAIETRYPVARNGEQIGEYTWEEILQYKVDGRLVETDFYLSGNEWVPV